MVYSSTITPEKDKVIISEADISTETTLTITVMWGENETALTKSDKYTVKLDSGSSGSVTVTSPNSGIFPTTVNYTNINEASKTATVAITVKGKDYGICKFAGALAEKPTEAQATAQIHLVPSKVKLVYQSFSQPALPLFTKPNPTPAENPNGTSNLAVKATDMSGKIVPNYLITFAIDYVRNQESKRTGVFYNGEQKLILSLQQINANLSTGLTGISTDEHGIATLTVVANSNAGHINCTPSTTEAGATESSFLYIFSSEVGTDPYPLTLLYGDVSDYSDTNFPVRINNGFVQPDEFIGLFLNDRFQEQTIGRKFQGGSPVIVEASISDLIVSDDPNKQNTLFYCRSQRGDLINSVRQHFPATGSNPIGPLPENPILTAMVNPSGGAINNGSINGPNNTELDYPAIMNVKNDVSIVQQNTSHTLDEGTIIRLFTKFQGDYIDTDKFRVTFNTFDYTLQKADLDSEKVTINIPYKDINGYGVPKQSTKTSEYTMWYGYLEKAGDLKPFASSPIVKGVLSTRAI